MQTSSLRILLLGAATALIAGCTHEARFQELTVPGLVEFQRLRAVTVYDVNTDDFRAAYGKIPGAILLDSSSSYDLALLPKEKDDKIAFYCTSRL